MDGSCFRDHTGNHAGYAIVRQTEVDTFQTEKAEKHLQPCSAQKAELKALISALILIILILRVYQQWVKQLISTLI